MEDPFLANHTIIFNFGWSGGKIIPEFGLIIFVAIFAWIINLAFAIQVGRSRRKFGISPPRMTETSFSQNSDLTNDTDRLTEGAVGETPEEYRRYQRVHLNNVENSAFFYGLLILAGIGFPFAAFLGGLWYQCFRIIGAIGYYQSTEKRSWGGAFHLGEFALVGLCFATAVRLLMQL